MEIRSLEVPAAAGAQRADRFLSEALPDLSRSAAQKLLENGAVTVKGSPVKKNQQVTPGMVLEVMLPDPEPIEAVPQNIPLDIVYEDSSVVVVNKARGMVVHPAPGNPDGTLVNALLYHCGSTLSGIGGAFRPGIVHRIDKDTTGLLVVAKNDKAHVSLAAQIAEKSCRRTYYALLEGNLKEDCGRVVTDIGRCPNDRLKMSVLPTGKGKIAITDFQAVARFGEECTLCRFDLQTGRTHQIRVHAKHLGHPIVGDPVYGYKKQKWNLGGQLLHAKKIGIDAPYEWGANVVQRAPAPRV